ncbi:CBU_0592 family membrane protein [Luedemannella helvata]|uniref:CBU-0592-like domain-containing protein n=1 Tax=Luedemannella helvata TaxID=349315 RepID=A0ABN2KLX3_9ACTN
MSEVMQVVGALLILAGFTAAQFGRLDPRSLPYLVVNVLGAGVLAVVAAVDGDWGFLLLEGVWTIVSAVSLFRLTRRPHTPRPAD